MGLGACLTRVQSGRSSISRRPHLHRIGLEAWSHSADEETATLDPHHGSLGWLLRAAAFPVALAAGLLALALAPRGAEALPVGDLWVSEVMYNPGGLLPFDDGGSEWVELFNAASRNRPRRS